MKKTLLLALLLLLVGCTTVIDQRPIEKIEPTYVMKSIHDIKQSTSIICYDIAEIPLRLNVTFGITEMDRYTIKKHYESALVVSDIYYPEVYFDAMWASQDERHEAMGKIHTCNMHARFSYAITAQNTTIYTTCMYDSDFDDDTDCQNPDLCANTAYHKLLSCFEDLR